MSRRSVVGTVYRATWRDAVLAESNQTTQVEGNQYFLLEDVRTEYLKPSGSHTVCHWKGTASYYDVVVEGETNRDAAWYYPTPKPAAEEIAGHIAFWKGVQIEEEE